MKYHILAVGVSKHQNDIKNLQFADKDATDFYTLFTNNVTDIGYKKLLINSEATFSAIRTALGQELRQAVGVDDTFFFFFSGHGATAEDQQGTALAHYLLPFDATRDIPSSSISIDYLKEAFGKIPSKSSFVFIDSCFSGSINGKGYNYPNKKGLKTIKKFTDEILGKGSVVFTASKADEEALEDPDNQNGLFAHFVLHELQKHRTEETYPVADIFTPVTQAVIDRAKNHFSHTQTPTVNVHFEGVVRLPVFKRPLRLSPQILEVPKHPQLTSAVFSAPEIEISDKQLQKVINDMVNLVLPSGSSTSVTQDIAYERFCWTLIKKLKESCDKQFEAFGSDVSKMPATVAQLEVDSMQLVLLGCVTTLFGENKKMEVYSEVVSDILSWGRGRSGLVALISMPEIILVNIMYVVGVTAIASKNLMPFKTLLYTRVEDSENDGEPLPIFAHNHIHYCDALGGYATKVADHVREVLKSYNWMPELLPRLKDDPTNYQLQVNLLLSMLLSKYGIRLWPDFGRFYSSRVKSIAVKVKYDSEFRRQLAALFEEKPDQIRQVLIDNMTKVRNEGLGGAGFFWESIGPQAFLTEEEIKAIKKEPA